MNIEEAVSKLINQLEADGRATSTIDQYDRHVRLMAHWCAHIGHSGDVSEITHEDIARFLSSPQARTGRHGGPKKATSMNALRTSIRVFFQYLHEAGYISLNPSRLVKRAICATPPPRAFSEKEVSRLMATIADGTSAEDRRDQVLFQLMLNTGIRLGSAVALNVEDVDLENGTIHLSTTKRNRPDQVYISKDIKKRLRRYLKERPYGPLFTTRNGSRLSSRQIQRRFGEWVEKAGITRSASVHSLRHTLGLHLYKQTGDIFLVQQMLRHKSIASTLVYTSISKNRIRNVVEHKLPHYI